MSSDVVVLTDDEALADVVAPQVTNLGRSCRWVPRSADVADALGSAAGIEAAVVDLAMAGGTELVAQLVDAGASVVAIAPDGRAADAVRERARAAEVVVEPFSIVELVEALRSLDPHPLDSAAGSGGRAAVIDLRRAAADHRPWWATR